MKTKNRLAPNELTSLCNPDVFAFKNTSTIEPLDQVIGQERAVKAIQFGLDMKSPGYNMFLTGPVGSGKTTILKHIVSRHAKSMPVPDEWCMVNNFSDDFMPKTLRFPAKKAYSFSTTLEKRLEALQSEIRRNLDDENFHAQVETVKKGYQEEQRKKFEELQSAAKEKHVHVQQSKSGFQTIPLGQEGVLTPEAFEALSDEDKKSINENIIEVQDQLKIVLREISKSNESLVEAVDTLTRQTTQTSVERHIDPVIAKYQGHESITRFLEDIKTDIIDNVEAFIEQAPPDETGQGGPRKTSRAFLDKYKINVLVDRRNETGAPVIFEPNPTYTNIFGQIEKRAFMNTISTDFSMIKAGSLLRANGGFLILDVESVLTSSFVWEALKRSLLNKKLSIEDFPSESGFGVSSMRPEPIPLDVKVILIGSYDLFIQLQNFDSKFNKIFKVRADFDYETQCTKSNIQLYAKFIARVCKEESLLPFTPEGVAAVIEYGERLISDKSKLSLRFGPIMDLIKESDYWARQASSRTIRGSHVKKARMEHHFRYSLYEEKIHESYTDNTLMIDVKGDVVGQVNGLAVYQIGETAFGRPSRITAETYMGKPGIINVEREADLSGRTHNKGVLIISGYLGRTFAQIYPLSLSISIAFEQNYSGVDGDSASSTELYAILSSLSEVPIQQGLAVTGSVNQKGIIQAIGGVNEKIEGFFDVCKSKGLTGNQGVLIPAANVKNLMLRNDVIQAVEKKRFHIYKVSTIEEGIELLTGVRAGNQDPEGNFPGDTVFGKVQQKLKTFFERSLKFKNQAFEFRNLP